MEKRKQKRNERGEWFDKSFSFGLVLQLMIKHVNKKKDKDEPKEMLFFFSCFLGFSIVQFFPPAQGKKLPTTKFFLLLINGFTNSPGMEMLDNSKARKKIINYVLFLSFASKIHILVVDHPLRR